MDHIMSLHSQILFCVELNNSHPLFYKIVEKAENILEKRYGAWTIAENCRDRAIKYLNEENYIQAIKELRKCENKWFSGGNR